MILKSVRFTYGQYDELPVWEILYPGITKCTDILKEVLNMASYSSNLLSELNRLKNRRRETIDELLKKMNVKEFGVQ